MTEENNTSNPASSSTGDEYMGQNEGTEAGEAEGEENNAAEDTAQNNPEDNKKLAEVTMMEQLRETYNLTVTFPKILKGLHTNQFFWLPVSDQFYETNYPTLISIVADTKFARFAGFEKGRFFVEKVEEKGGNDGWSTTLTLNPIPPSLAIWSQKQKEAQKALMHAINWETRGSGGGGSSVSANGADCNPEDGYETNHWGGSHRQYPPVCTSESKTVHGNSSRQYAKDTASHNNGPQELINYVKGQWAYQGYPDNPYGQEKCPEDLWTGDRPMRANCADSARLLKCILDVNGYQSITCHIPGHFFNAIWENGGWTICDLCNGTPYGHANHENEGDCHPIGTWDSPLSDGFTKTSW